MQHRIVDGPDLQFNPARVAKLFGQGNILPAKLRLAHIDRDDTLVLDRGVEHARDCLELEV